MYINFKQLGTNLQRGDLELLCAIKQGETEYLITNSWHEALARFRELDFITEVKGKKKDDHPYKALRLTDKAKKLLVSIETPDVLEEDEKVFEWLKNMYLNAGKVIGNGAKTKRHIRDFRVKSGIEKNNLIKLVLAFLKENEEKSNKLEYVFYFPKTAFATRFDLEESWLWTFFVANKDRLEKTFEDYNK